MDLEHIVASFLVAICVLVAVHEFGHYWVARRLGVKVLRFSIGFGPAIRRWTGRDADRATKQATIQAAVERARRRRGARE